MALVQTVQVAVVRIVILKVPVGTIVDTKSATLLVTVADGQRVKVAHGGDGGLGNTHFKSSTNRSPRVNVRMVSRANIIEVRLELKCLQVGLLACQMQVNPTFIRSQCGQTKVADYPFTTMVPNLGGGCGSSPFVRDGGYSRVDRRSGRGRGSRIRFLKHLARTVSCCILHRMSSRLMVLTCTIPEQFWAS